MDYVVIISVGLAASFVLSLAGYVVFSEVRGNLRQKKRIKETKEAEARYKIINDYEQQQREAKERREEAEKKQYFMDSLYEQKNTVEEYNNSLIWCSYTLKEDSKLWRDIKKIVQQEIEKQKPTKKAGKK